MRASSALVAASLLLPLGACSSSDNADGPNEYVTDCEAASGSSGTLTSDENYTAFVNAEAAGNVKKDGCKSPELTSPAAGATLDPNTPPHFVFRATHASCALRRTLPAVRWSMCSQPAPLWERALDTALMISTAQAHCAAITGENYLLELAGKDGKAVYSAMLSVVDFTPDAAKWKSALSGHGGETLTLTIERAVFLKGDIDEGPYVQPQGWTFSVAK